MMKRLLISTASLTLALAFTPAFGSSHGDDGNMDSMEKEGMEMEEHRQEMMDRDASSEIDVENLPPTAAGQESEDGMDDEMQDSMNIPPDETDPATLEPEDSGSEY